MTNAQTGTLVLKDQAGNYFLVPQTVLEQCRVPEEHKAEVERLMNEADDTQGHLLAFVVGVAIGYFGTKAIIEGSRDGGLNANDYAQQMAGVGQALQQQTGGRNR